MGWLIIGVLDLGCDRFVRGLFAALVGLLYWLVGFSGLLIMYAICLVL